MDLVFIKKASFDVGAQQETKKSPAQSTRESEGVRQPLPDRVSPQHNGGIPFMGSGCGCLIADCSFVCQTTPHFGSTSRKASYSVRAYITPNFPICKDPIVQFLSNKAFPCHPERVAQRRAEGSASWAADSSTPHLRCCAQNDKRRTGNKYLFSSGCDKTTGNFAHLVL